jgi:hypothetical protein
LGRIAVTMLDFSVRVRQDRHRLAHHPGRRQRRSLLARTILALPRTPGDRTSVGNALELGAAAIRGSEKDNVASRNVIDVTGDGPNNTGKPMLQLRDRTLAQGINRQRPSGDRSRRRRIFPQPRPILSGLCRGRPGAFVLVVNSYKDFASAMRRKLILEISQNEQATKQADAETNRQALMRRIAAAPSYIRKARTTQPRTAAASSAPCAQRILEPLRHSQRLTPTRPAHQTRR